MGIFTDSNNEALELRNSGQYPIASLTLFDSIEQLKFSDFILEKEHDIIEIYNNYVDFINNLSKQRRSIYLEAIRREELRVNQLMEKEDPFTIELSLAGNREYALDYLLGNGEMSEDKLIKAHQILLNGTESEKYCKRKYRNENSTNVTKSGYFQGPAPIHYFAIDYKDIPEALQKTVEYYKADQHSDHKLIKPIITHGIIAGLQMFDDGNTRLARTVQNVELFDLSKLDSDFKLKKPVLYNSGTYKQYAEQYRNLVADLVIDENDEVWNKWIDFGLNRIEDQLYMNNTRVSRYKEKTYI